MSVMHWPFCPAFISCCYRHVFYFVQINMDGRWILSWPWNVGQRSLKVIENGTIWKFGYGFLFDFHSNYGRIFSHFWDIQRQRMACFEIWVWGLSRSLKMARFDIDHVWLSIGPPLWLGAFHWAYSNEKSGRQPVTRSQWNASGWPTGGRKAPGRQTPALSRISKNRRAGNFYAIWGGAQILK